VHGYVDSEDGYMQLEFLSKTDWDMRGKAVRRDAAAEAPLVDENYDIFAELKAGRLIVVAAT
jgi:hypothetical protein